MLRFSSRLPSELVSTLSGLLIFANIDEVRDAVVKESVLNEYLPNIDLIDVIYSFLLIDPRKAAKERLRQQSQEIYDNDNDNDKTSFKRPKMKHFRVDTRSVDFDRLVEKERNMIDKNELSIQSWNLIDIAIQRTKDDIAQLFTIHHDINSNYNLLLFKISFFFAIFIIVVVVTYTIIAIILASVKNVPFDVSKSINTVYFYLFVAISIVLAIQGIFLTIGQKVAQNDIDWIERNIKILTSKQPPPSYLLSLTHLETDVIGPLLNIAQYYPQPFKLLKDKNIVFVDAETVKHLKKKANEQQLDMHGHQIKSKDSIAGQKWKQIHQIKYVRLLPTVGLFSVCICFILVLAFI